MRPRIEAVNKPARASLTCPRRARRANSTLSGPATAALVAATPTSPACMNMVRTTGLSSEASPCACIIWTAVIPSSTCSSQVSPTRTETMFGRTGDSDATAGFSATKKMA